MPRIELGGDVRVPGGGSPYPSRSAASFSRSPDSDPEDSADRRILGT